MSSILGTLAMLVSLSVVFFGLTSQAWKNYKRKTCEGLSLTLMMITLLAYSVWAAYGLSKPDWYLAGSQMPGAILCLIIIGQYLVYDFRHESKLTKLREELEFVSGQINIIVREQASLRENLTRVDGEQRLEYDDRRDQRMKARTDELRSNQGLLGQLAKRKEFLEKQLGIVKK